MKIIGARGEAFSAMRRRALAQAAAQARPGAPAADSAAFLGLGEAELTPAVRTALQTLLTEIGDLRGEVGRLRARLAEVEGLADRDALTPLLNRRALMRELSRIRAFCQRYGAAASLVYFDIDGLKGINDQLGHAAGDAALRTMAERLSANVRASDVVGRMGGDEFAIILAQADGAAADAKAQAVAAAIEGEPVRFGDWSAPLHVSWGVAEIRPDGDPEAVVAEADRAMYARKRRRRAG